jgi:hypothetical protein
MKMEMNEMTEMIEKTSRLELAIQNSRVGNDLEYLDVACTLGTPFQAAWALQGRHQECARQRRAHWYHCSDILMRPRQRLGSR